MSMTQIYNPKEMAARGRIGGYALRATHDPQLYTLAGRNAFLTRFVPTDPSLTETERQARAQAGLRAYMMRLSRLSALKRANGGKGAQHD